jgi:ABC-2 type transport system ATP-binding protein
MEVPVRIELTQVRKSFDGVVALDDVTFDVPAGGRVALVGPNGSGKSTVVRAVLGLVRCEGVRVGGHDAFTDRLQIASRIAYVPQTAPLTSATVGEMVRTVAALRGADAEAVRRVADALSMPLVALDARPVRSLSGGMRQKLLIALALATPVSLVVLDEPTASLDARSRDAVFDLLDERAAGATLIVNSHGVDEVRRLADRVITLEGGRVAGDESARAWLARGEGWRAGVSRPETKEACA